MKRFRLGVLAGALVACASAPAQDSSTRGSSSQATGASSSDVPDCEHLFDVPQGAELLCDEHIMAGTAEIHWRSFGLSEARPNVNERYQKRAAACGASLTFKPPLFSVSVGELKLQTYDPSPVSFPTCAKTPGTQHYTILVLSEKHDR